MTLGRARRAAAGAREILAQRKDASAKSRRPITAAATAPGSAPQAAARLLATGAAPFRERPWRSHHVPLSSTWARCNVPAADRVPPHECQCHSIPLRSAAAMPSQARRSHGLDLLDAFG
jgi:hypothetical protein